MTRARLLIATAVVLGLMLFGAWIFGGPIIRHFQGKADKAVAKAETATDATVAAQETLTAERNLDRQAVDLQVTVEAARDRLVIAKEEIHADPETSDALGGDAVARVRRDDEWLCQQSPRICGVQRPPEGRDAG